MILYIAPPAPSHPFVSLFLQNQVSWVHGPGRKRSRLGSGLPSPKGNITAFAAHPCMPTWNRLRSVFN